MASTAKSAFERSASAIATALILAGPATAQQQFIGQWSCEFSYTEYNSYGNRTSGFTMAFAAAVQPDGSFYAQGQEQSIMGVSQFQAQGNWGVENGPRGPLFSARGQMSGQNGVSPFGFIGFMGPDNQSLYHSQDIPNTQTGGILSRSSTGCVRTG